MNPELIPNHLVNVDEDLESAILSTVLMEPRLSGTLLRYIKKPAVFYFEAHQLIYRAIEHIHAEGGRPDLVSINRWLIAHKAPEAVDMLFLVDLVGKASLPTIDRHCLILFELAIKRFLAQYGGELRRAAMDPSSDALTLLDKVDADIDGILGSISSIGEKNANDYLREVFDDIVAKKEGKKRGIYFGITQLDERTGGFAGGNFIVLAGGTGQGKTGVITHVVRHQCLVEKNHVGVFTLEMTGKEYMERLVAAESDYSNSELNRAKGIEFTTLHHKTTRLIDMPLHIHDKPIESRELQFKIREWVRRYGVKIVFIDYLQLIKDSRYKTAYERNSNLSMDLKALAGELGIVIVAASQLSREFEKRKDTDKRPMLSDLRETGQLEQDANAVIFVFRPYKYGIQYPDGSCDEFTMELHGLKFRGARPTDRHDPWLFDYDGACNRIARFNSLRYSSFLPEVSNKFPETEPNF